MCFFYTLYAVIIGIYGQREMILFLSCCALRKCRFRVKPLERWAYKVDSHFLSCLFFMCSSKIKE